MTTAEERLAAAGRARAEAMGQRTDRPRQRRGAVTPDEVRAGGDRGLGLRQVVDDEGRARWHLAARMSRSEVTDKGAGVVEYRGVASVTEYGYTVYDMFGPYTEIVDRGAFDATLARPDLDVPLVIAHDQIRRIARTTNGSLSLAVDPGEGLTVHAPELDMGDGDVAYIVPKLRSGLVDEMSFAFRIDAGQWNADYTEYRITAVDLHRGDVAIVGYGANPATSGGVVEKSEVPARSDAAAGEARDEAPAAVAPGAGVPAGTTNSSDNSEQRGLEMDGNVELGAGVEQQQQNGDAEALAARLADVEEQLRIAQAARAADAGGQQQEERGTASVRVGAEPRTYTREKDKRGKGREFLSDVAAAFRGDFMARDRLERHTREEMVEREAQVAGQMQRATTTANFTGWVVPQYLVDLNAEAAVAGRAFADVCRSHDLPETGMTCYLSKISTGSSVADQSSEGATVSETSMDDTQISIAVRTAAGAQTISRQAVERGLGVDDVTFADLVKRYNQNLDSNLFNAATHGLTNVATSVAYTDASPTAAELYPKIQGAASGAETSFQDMVSDLVVVMHSRRWRWLAASMTSTWPFIAGPGSPTQAGALSNGSLKGVRGYLPDGTPVVTDNNIATNLGAGTNEDEVYVVNPDEAHLWEDPSAPMLIRAETNPKGLQLDLVLYGYYAFYLDRYTGGHRKVAGTGLVTPTF